MDAEAEKELNDLISMSPTGRYAADALLKLAEIALKTNDWTRATALLDRVIETFPFHPRYLEGRCPGSSRLIAESKRWDRAEQLWAKYIDECQNASDVFQAHLEIAKVFQHQGDHDKAIHHAEIAARSTQRDIIAELAVFTQSNQREPGRYGMRRLRGI